MKFAKTVLGGTLFNILMKSSFYGHFVAGEDRYKVVPTLERFFIFFFAIFFNNIKYVFQLHLSMSSLSLSAICMCIFMSKEICIYFRIYQGKKEIMNGFLGRVILHIEHKLQLIIYIGGKRSGSKFHLKREFH